MGIFKCNVLEISLLQVFTSAAFWMKNHHQKHTMLQEKEIRYRAYALTDYKQEIQSYCNGADALTARLPQSNTQIKISMSTQHRVIYRG